MNALIAGLFPYVAARSQAAPFAFFAAMMALQFVIVLLRYPETRGSSLEAIQAQLRPALNTGPKNSRILHAG